jgi:hypothetical protein
MFDEQVQFMRLLQEKRGFPNFPVDLSTKQGQKFVKEMSHECMHEMFEAIHLLSDSKDHRRSMTNDFDREKFLEEMSDALHYFIEVCALIGIGADDLYDAYTKKGRINISRISSGY